VVPVVARETHWVCPNCTLTDVTNDPRPHSRFHACSGLRGISAPMVEDGIRCKVEANERDDYVGDEIVTRDAEGRPVMNVITTRDDGTDCAVFAPCATAKLGEQ
jgi:hypothetical protein